MAAKDNRTLIFTGKLMDGTDPTRAAAGLAQRCRLPLDKAQAIIEAGEQVRSHGGSERMLKHTLLGFADSKEIRVANVQRLQTQLEFIQWRRRILAFLEQNWGRWEPDPENSFIKTDDDQFAIEFDALTGEQHPPWLTDSPLGRIHSLDHNIHRTTVAKNINRALNGPSHGLLPGLFRIGGRVRAQLYFRVFQ